MFVPNTINRYALYRPLVMARIIYFYELLNKFSLLTPRVSMYISSYIISISLRYNHKLRLVSNLGVSMINNNLFKLHRQFLTFLQSSFHTKQNDVKCEKRRYIVSYNVSLAHSKYNIAYLASVLFRV